MSGVTNKLLTFLSLAALLVACVTVLTSDSYADEWTYVGSEVSPVSGDVDVDVSAYGKYCVYITEGSTVTLDHGQTWSRITFSPSSARTSLDKSSDGLNIFDSSTSSIDYFGYTAGFAGDNWTYVYVYVIDDGSGSGDSGDSGDSGSGEGGSEGAGDGESDSGDDSGDSGSGSGESDSGDDSGDSGSSGSEGGESDSGSSSDDSGSGSADDNGGSSSDGDQSSAGDDNSDWSEEDLSDSSTVERQSSPVLAIIILVAGALLVWWVIKKVR